MRNVFARLMTFRGGADKRSGKGEVATSSSPEADDRLKDMIGRLSATADPIEIGSIIKEASLSITAPASGVRNTIDLEAASWHAIVDACIKAFASTGTQLYILTNESVWQVIQSSNDQFSSVSINGLIELAVVRDDQLLDRLSVNLWRKSADGWLCASIGAPIKKRANITRSFDVDLPYDTNVGPIDAVYTWVNSSDEEWRSLFARHASADWMDPDRFSQADELRFSLRSLFTYAPWVRKVFIVTNCAPPAWFQASSRLEWVQHDGLIPKRYLPLFNSHAIETFLHEIPGLSEQYVYFNDDVFLAGVVLPTDFFGPYGVSVARLEQAGLVSHLRELTSLSRAEEWQHAVVNSANLLLTETGIFPTRLHGHVPHAFLKSVYAEMVRRYPAEFHITRTSRFRQNTDFAFTSFFYHYYAASQRRAVLANEESIVVRPSNFKRFIAQKLHIKHRFFCINDGGGSSARRDYKAFKDTFLQQRFPFKSPAEA